MDVEPHRIPLHGLGLPDEVVATLRHLGLRSLADLQRVPRTELPDRFGAIILLRIDQIEGRIHEPLPPIEVLKPISLRERWDSAVDGIEPLHPLFEQLINHACALLTRRGQAARRVVVTLRRYRQAEITLDLPFSIPTRDPQAILRLLRLALDREMMPIKRRASIGIEGFVGIDLVVPETAPHHHDQPDLPGADEGHRHDPLAVHRLAEGLRARLGSEAIRALVPHESHLPERSWREVDVVEADAVIQTHANGQRIKRSSNTSNPRRTQDDPSKQGRVESAGLAEWFTTMFDPREIRVVVSPSHDRDGRPVQVGIDGLVRRVVACRGPHRIAGEWWRGHDKTRDYFDIELDDHRRLLVFRVCDNARWFVQGENG
jgi:protein ImuB